MPKTKIEWTDRTWNPLRGCSKVSPGCRGCYAEAIAERFSGAGQAFDGFAERGKGWTGKVALVPHLLPEPLGWRTPSRVFVNSMSDLFHESLHDGDIAAVLGIVKQAPRHTFQVLTKRAARLRDFGRKVPCLTTLPNLWLGVSVENQEAADERIPLLLQTPAAVRFLSVEPLLGPVTLYHWLSTSPSALAGKLTPDRPSWTRIGTTAVDWVIVGGESGHGARPMHPDWARSIRDQCVDAGVPFFFKQFGEWQAFYDRDRDDPDWQRCPKLTPPHERWMNIASGRGFHGDRIVAMRKVGKKAAGRTLDGRTWDELPSSVRR